MVSVLTMDELRLREIIKKPEGPKLEFKQAFYQLNIQDANIRNQHWSEFIKDILSIANGNIGFASQEGYLIIGVGDYLGSTGRRSLYSCANVDVDIQQALRKVNEISRPPLPNLDVDRVNIDGCEIIVITVPVTPHLHETTRDLRTTGRTFPEGTVFIRRGDDIRNATQQEREDILREKKIAFPSPLKEREIEIIENRIDLLRITREQKRGEPCESNTDQSNTESEIDKISVQIDFLEKKLSFREKKRTGKTCIKYAKAIINRPEFTADADIADEAREEVLRALKEAIRMGEKSVWVYYQIVRLLDQSELLLDAYDWGCEAIESGCIEKDLHQLHLKICLSIRELYPDYRDEAGEHISYHKQQLCRILNVASVNDWGEPE